MRFILVLAILISSSFASAAGGGQCELLFKPNLVTEVDLPRFIKIALMKSSLKSPASIEEHRRFFRMVRAWRADMALHKTTVADTIENRISNLMIARMEDYLTLTENSFNRVNELSEFGARRMLFLRASPEGSVDKLMSAFSKRYPKYRVMYDPQIYLRTGFAAWIVGNRLGIGDPTLMTEPGARSGDFLHELVHIRVDGAEGSVRALVGDIPMFRDVARPAYGKFQSHDESTAYSMTFRRELKDLEKAIREKDEFKVRHHLLSAAKATTMMIEVTGRNIWTSGMVLHNFGRMDFNFNAKSLNQMVATAEIVAEGSRILATMPVESTSSNVTELRPLVYDKYVFMYERDVRLHNMFTAFEMITGDLMKSLETGFDPVKLETARRALYSLYLNRGGEARTVKEWVELYRQQVNQR